jgi:colicin import membrane protein
MKRLHKKCVIASAGVHLLLVLILFVGPAFLAPKTKMPDMPLLDFVPFETVDALVSGGGNPNATPPPAQLNAPPEPKAPVIETPPPPKPEPKKPDPKPEPVPEKPKEAAMVPEPRKKPQVSLTPVVRKPTTTERNNAKANKEEDEARRKFAEAIKSAANAIPGSVSSSTTIELKGPGGGGIPYANFLQAVKTVYTRAWVLPDNIADDDATVGTSVTIARDGSVISAKITRPSGNRAVDQSVRATLDAVRYAAPLPRDAKEDQRTVTIDFNVRAKRLLG